MRDAHILIMTYHLLPVTYHSFYILGDPNIEPRMHYNTQIALYLQELR
jgi:hypothetical protein